MIETIAVKPSRTSSPVKRSSFLRTTAVLGGQPLGLPQAVCTAAGRQRIGEKAGDGHRPHAARGNGLGAPVGDQFIGIDPREPVPDGAGIGLGHEADSREIEMRRGERHALLLVVFGVGRKARFTALGRPVLSQEHS